MGPTLAWAALDCPSGWAVEYGAAADGPPFLLARLAAQVLRPLESGRPHVVVAWERARDGRKRHAVSAIYTADGDLTALARALWIQPRAADPASR
jgi:hypothetical protein